MPDNITDELRDLIRDLRPPIRMLSLTDADPEYKKLVGRIDATLAALARTHAAVPPSQQTPTTLSQYLFSQYNRR